MDLDIYVRVRTCKKRVTGKQPSCNFCFAKVYKCNFHHITSMVKLLKTHPLFCQIFLNIYVLHNFICSFLKLCTWLESAGKCTQTRATLSYSRLLHYIGMVTVVKLLNTQLLFYQMFLKIYILHNFTCSFP